MLKLVDSYRVIDRTSDAADLAQHGYDAQGQWTPSERAALVAERQGYRHKCKNCQRFLWGYLAVMVTLTLGLLWLVRHFAPQIDAWGK